MRGSWLIGLTVLSLAFAGCGGKPAGNGGDEPGSGADSGSGSYKRRDLESLPAVGAYLPPLDDGRVQVAPPENWMPLPRDSRYLVRFFRTKPGEAPRLEVSVTDVPDPDTDDTTKENAAALIKQLTQYHLRLGRKFQEPPRPIVLGNHVFIRNVRMANRDSELWAIVCLQTVREGRLYTVELMVNAGPNASNYDEAIKKDQDAAYTVAAHLKFKGDESATAEPMEEKTDAKEKTEENGQDKEKTEE
jgi:hypothetical protein